MMNTALGKVSAVSEEGCGFSDTVDTVWLKVNPSWISFVLLFICYKERQVYKFDN
jgi:hypothetical protein